MENTMTKRKEKRRKTKNTMVDKALDTKLQIEQRNPYGR
jgi:hypothetical protein